MNKATPYPFKRLKQSLGKYYGLRPDLFSHVLLMFVHYDSEGYSDEDRKPFIDLLGAVLGANMITKQEVVRLMQSIENGVLATRWLEEIKYEGGAPKVSERRCQEIDDENIAVGLGGVAGVSPAPQRMIDVLNKTMNVEQQKKISSSSSSRKNSSYQDFIDNMNVSRSNALSSTLYKPVIGHKPSYIARIKTAKPASSFHRRHPPGMLDPDKLAALALEIDLYQRMNNARWDGYFRKGYRG